MLSSETRDPLVAAPPAGEPIRPPRAPRPDYLAAIRATLFREDVPAAPAAILPDAKES